MRSVVRPSVRIVGALAGTIAVVSCGSGGGGGDAERFCSEIDTNRQALTDPTIEFADDIEPFLDLYRSIGELAPIAIDAEWGQLVLNYETAATVVPGDTDSEQLAVATALQSEQSAAAVDNWLRDNCGLDLGPMSTLVAHDG